MSRIESLLDEGFGERLLANPVVAKIVEDCLWHGHGKDYSMLAYVIMPTHVHTVLTLSEHSKLAKVVQSLKGFSAHEINRVLGRSGSVWQVDYFDRLIRSLDQLDKTIRYIEWNPVKAKLALAPKDFRYSSAHPDIRHRLLGND